MHSRMRRNITLGLVVGICLATLYSAWAVGVRLLSGAEAFAKHQTTIGAVLVTYYVAGVVGGVAVGAMIPLSRNIFGRIAIGLVAATIFFTCVFVATDGPVWVWSVTTWQNLAFSVFVFGIICSAMWKTATGR